MYISQGIQFFEEAYSRLLVILRQKRISVRVLVKAHVEEIFVAVDVDDGEWRPVIAGLVLHAVLLASARLVHATGTCGDP